MSKCTPAKNGYAATMCDALLSVTEIFPSKRSKGIYRASIVNLETRERLGEMVRVKQGEHLANGLVFNYCPFCGGELRDFAGDGE